MPNPLDPLGIFGDAQRRARGKSLTQAEIGDLESEYLALAEFPGVHRADTVTLARLYSDILVNAQSRAYDYLFDQLIAFGLRQRDVVRDGEYNKALITKVVNLEQRFKIQFMQAIRGG